ncbi:MAG: alpha-L-fucosidase [Chitinophagaceae bacterium]|nr:alpha-L-fucosidase [Chitinophagaceae bacterium]
MRNQLLTAGFFLLLSSVYSSVSAQHEKYQAPSDTLVQQKLTQWQNLKFGLLMHWGPYSQWGVVESWSICPEDEGWTQRTGPYAKTYTGYVKAYEDLQKSFNPVLFNPEKWAKAAKEAGMKYVVFTTKHHDGFCMFDSKETDYKITGSASPFATHPKSNVTKEIFTAFRKQGFWTGAYFSKPDWHHENYWWPYFPPKDRNVNYDPVKYPEKWQAYKKFTYNQLQELMRDYGKMDILWLDGGWVRPLSTVDTSVDWQRGIKQDQDIDMPGIAAMARSYQPGLLIVDRTVTGEYENYTTPEQQVPDKPLPFPWETCMTMGGSWSYVPNDRYKSAGELIQLLIKIVSRGGNFLLNIGPGPDGEWATDAYDRLREIGQWMQLNGEGIYNSRPLAPYSSGNLYFTAAQNDQASYVFCLPDSNGKWPEQITLPANLAKKGALVRIAGEKNKLTTKREGEELQVRLPERVNEKYRHALLLKITH